MVRLQFRPLVPERIRRLLKRRKSHSAISKLPEEIMGEIFMVCTVASPTVTPVLLSISAVCSRWRQIALNMARLWSTISLNEGELWTLELLRRSMDASLTIQCPRGDFQSGLRFEKLCSVFVREARRFGDLVIRSKMDDILPLTSCFLPPNSTPCAPLLRTLTLEAEVCGSNEPPKILSHFWTKLPSLQSLRLCNILLMDVATPYMPVLTSLSIFAVRTGKHLSVSWILNLLRHTPMIRHIDIGIIASNDAAGTSDTLPVTLLHLVDLDLRFYHIRETKLLTYLIFPSSTYVSLEYSNDKDDPDLKSGGGGGLPHLQKMIYEAVPLDVESIEVGVMVADDECAIEDCEIIVKDYCVPSVPPILSLTISHFPLATRRYANLFGSLPWNKICSLHLSGIENDDEAKAWSLMLPLLINLGTISLYMTSLPILHTLGMTVPSSDSNDAHLYNLGLTRIAVENLKAHFSTPDDWALLTKNCRLRYQRGAPIELLKIQCSSIQREDATRLAQWITEVEWDEERCQQS